jgi:hypothetical protein
MKEITMAHTASIIDRHLALELTAAIDSINGPMRDEFIRINDLSIPIAKYVLINMIARLTDDAREYMIIATSEANLAASITSVNQTLSPTEFWKLMNAGRIGVSQNDES